VPDITIDNTHVDYSIILKPRVKSAMVTGGIRVALMVSTGIRVTRAIA
jgi:hypothetical protein